VHCDCLLLLPFCKQKVTSYYPSNQSVRQEHFFNVLLLMIFLHHPSNTSSTWLFGSKFILPFSTTDHFSMCVFSKEIQFFKFNSWLSFQQLCRFTGDSCLLAHIILFSDNIVLQTTTDIKAYRVHTYWHINNLFSSEWWTCCIIQTTSLLCHSLQPVN